MRRLSLVAALMLASMATACGDRDRAPDKQAGSTTTEQPSTTTTQDQGRFATTPVSAVGTERGLLAAVSAGADGGREQVTFEFEGALPGYRVAYTPRPIVEDGSGDEVAVAGEAVLMVHFEPASGVELSGDQVRTVYGGPRRIDPGLTAIAEVVRVTDFEANLEWAVGVVQEIPFRVRTLAGPARVVVELQLPTGG